MAEKKNSKRKRMLALVLVPAILLSGCQNRSDGVSGAGRGEGGRVASGKEAGQEGKLKVVATIFPYYDFVRQVAGDLVDLTMIVPAGMDAHSFEPTAADMITMSTADLLVYNGGEGETWVPAVLKAAENTGMVADAMMGYVDTVREEHVEGMNREKGHGEQGQEHEAETDEHIWTSPENARKIVAQIAKDLAQADPQHRETYLENAGEYMEELEELHERMKRVVKDAEGHYLVFGDRFPLRYFVEEYGLDYTAAFSGCGSETEPSADTIAYLTDQVKERHLPVVLKIELTSPRVADAIAEAAGARVETFSTCHNVTREEFCAGVTYLSLMENNILVLQDALAVR